MKVKRQKNVRKFVLFYKNNFGYETPFKVLIDGTFCKAALKFRINIAEQLPKYLDAEVRMFTTPCVLSECEALGTLLYGPLKVLRQFDVHSCGHTSPVLAFTCLRQCIKKNKHKFFVATQDANLSDKVRETAGVPLLFISHNAINLESPSDLSKQKAERTLAQKLAPSSHQESTLDIMKKQVFGEPEKVIRKKRKGPKGPNPLSCKKKKKKPADIATSQTKSQKKRKRKRKKENQEDAPPLS